MTGKELKIKLKKLGVDLAEVARLINVSPQNLQSKLKSDDLKLSFIADIAKAVNKNIYELLNEVETNLSNSTEMEDKNISVLKDKIIELQTEVILLQKEIKELKR